MWVLPIADVSSSIADASIAEASIADASIADASIADAWSAERRQQSVKQGVIDGTTPA